MPAYSRRAMRRDTHSFYGHTIQRTIERLAGHLDEAADLRVIAAEAGLSPFYFHRLFRGMVGETPLELLRRLRMERAAWRLLHTQQPVTRIAGEAGYETHEAFTRAFRACYGTAPSDFRRRDRGQIELAALCGVHFDPAGRVPAFISRDTGGDSMDVQIIHRPALRLATVRHTGPYGQIGEAFERLGVLAGPAELFNGPETEMLALYYDDLESTPPDQLQSDAAITVPEDATLPDGLQEQRLPAGPYARYLHTGPYAHLGDVWARLIGEWLPAAGHTIGDSVCYEVYLNSPGQVPDEELQTVLYLPIAT